jgi:hypothetical protein
VNAKAAPYEFGALEVVAIVANAGEPPLLEA